MYVHDRRIQISRRRGCVDLNLIGNGRQRRCRCDRARDAERDHIRARVRIGFLDRRAKRADRSRGGTAVVPRALICRVPEVVDDVGGGKKGSGQEQDEEETKGFERDMGPRA